MKATICPYCFCNEVVKTFDGVIDYYYRDSVLTQTYYNSVEAANYTCLLCRRSWFAGEHKKILKKVNGKQKNISS